VPAKGGCYKRQRQHNRPVGCCARFTHLLPAQTRPAGAGADGSSSSGGSSGSASASGGGGGGAAAQWGVHIEYTGECERELVLPWVRV